MAKPMLLALRVGAFVLGMIALVLVIACYSHSVPKSEALFGAIGAISRPFGPGGESLLEDSEPSRRIQSSNGTKPCDVEELLRHGDAASYFIFSTYHKKYMSTDGKNADMYPVKGSHASWKLQRVSNENTNKFFVVSDWAEKYMSAQGKWNYANVIVMSRPSRYADRRRKQQTPQYGLSQWLLFSAKEITSGAPDCTFYIMNAESYKWLDTHGDNSRVWGDNEDIWNMGDFPENLQWELQPVR